MPADVSQAGTNVMMPSTGMTTCSSGLNRRVPRVEDRPK